MRHGSRITSELQGLLPQSWMPHRETNESWSVFALVHDEMINEAAFGVHVNVKLARPGIDSFCLVDYEVIDISKLEIHNSTEKIWHIFNRQQNEMLFDKESILCRSSIQMLLAQDSLALKITSADISMDLCLDFTTGGDFMEDSPNGLMIGRGYFKRKHYLQFLHVPEVKCFGRLNIQDRSVRVVGLGCVQRTWGKYPFRLAKFHEEQFVLMINNGDQIPVLSFPISDGKTFAGIFSPGCNMQHCQGVTLTAMEFTEIDDWRFAKGWKLELPEYSEDPFYLVPLVDTQYGLPMSFPFMTVLNGQGDRAGYAFSSLAPGARNELHRIPLSIYR